MKQEVLRNKIHKESEEKYEVSCNSVALNRPHFAGNNGGEIPPRIITALVIPGI
jgi:hypothetical protein